MRNFYKTYGILFFGLSLLFLNTSIYGQATPSDSQDNTIQHLPPICCTKGDVLTVESCCEAAKNAGQNVFWVEKNNQYACCQNDSKKDYSGATHELCCEEAGGKLLANGVCCKQISTQKTKDADPSNPQMCKKS